MLYGGMELSEIYCINPSDSGKWTIQPNVTLMYNSYESEIQDVGNHGNIPRYLVDYFADC